MDIKKDVEENVIGVIFTLV